MVKRELKDVDVVEARMQQYSWKAHAYLRENRHSCDAERSSRFVYNVLTEAVTFFREQLMEAKEEANNQSERARKANKMLAGYRKHYKEMQITLKRETEKTDALKRSLRNLRKISGVARCSNHKKGPLALHVDAAGITVGETDLGPSGGVPTN